MPHARLDVFDHAVHTAYTWVGDVAKEFGTEDRRFAYRALRAWLHTLRDRLPVEGAAKFAAQLPELLRGVYYEGWEPHRVPVKYGADEYVLRFGQEAKVPLTEVRHAAATVTQVVGRHLSPGQLSEALVQLPHGLRALLLGSEAIGEDAAAAREEGSSLERLHRLESQVGGLIEAVTVLTRSLEEIPGQEPDEHRSAKAARIAHEILLTTGR